MRWFTSGSSSELECGEAGMAAAAARWSSPESAVDLDRVSEAYRRLPVRSRVVLALRVMDDDPWPLWRVARLFRVSQQRVHQIEQEALAKLRATLSISLA